MNKFSVPANRPLRLYRGDRFGVAAFFCLSVLLSGVVAWSSGSSPYFSNDTRSAQGKEITYRGCLWRSAHRHGWVLVGLEERHDEGDVNSAFELVGDTSALEKYESSSALSVRGIELLPPGKNYYGGELPGELEVKHVEALRPVAELDKSFTDASHWIRKTDPTYGLSFAVSKEWLSKGHASNDLGSSRLQIFDTTFPTSAENIHHDGHLSIYVDTAASEKDTYSTGNWHPSHRNPPAQSAPANKNFEWVNGVKYTRFVCDGYVGADDCSIYTFQNNLSYKFNFSIERGQPGMLEWGCLVPEIDDQQERTFLRLFFSHVSFSRPEVPAPLRAK